MDEFSTQISLEINDIIKQLSMETHEEYMIVLFILMLAFFIASYFFYYQGKHYVKNENMLSSLKESSDLKLDLIKYISFANFSK